MSKTSREEDRLILQFLNQQIELSEDHGQKHFLKGMKIDFRYNLDLRYYLYRAAKAYSWSQRCCFNEIWKGRPASYLPSAPKGSD